MPIKKSKSTVKQRIEEEQRKALLVSDEAQNRLAAILADSPSIETLAGTEWEMRPLHFGTMHLMADEICKINKAESATYGDVLKVLLVQIPVTFKVLTLALLNDKNLIFQNGDKNQGYSKLFKKTYDTIEWNATKEELAKIMLDCMEMIDVSFFMGPLDMPQIFRAMVTGKKRTRKKTAGQK